MKRTIWSITVTVLIGLIALNRTVEPLVAQTGIAPPPSNKICIPDTCSPKAVLYSPIGDYLSRTANGCYAHIPIISDEELIGGSVASVPFFKTLFKELEDKYVRSAFIEILGDTPGGTLSDFSFSLLGDVDFFKAEEYAAEVVRGIETKDKTAYLGVAWSLVKDMLLKAAGEKIYSKLPGSKKIPKTLARLLRDTPLKPKAKDITKLLEHKALGKLLQVLADKIELNAVSWGKLFIVKQTWPFTGLPQCVDLDGNGPGQMECYSTASLSTFIEKYPFATELGKKSRVVMCAAPTDRPADAIFKQPGLIADFENFGSWQQGNQKWGYFDQSQEQVHSGRSSGKFTYNFPASNDNYIVFRQAKAISGKPNALQLWVLGDASNNFLHVWVKDKTGTQWQFSFGQIAHTGWQQMTAYLSTSLGWPNVKISGNGDQPVYPIGFDGLVLDGIDGKDSQGVIFVDDLTATTITAPPPVPLPVPAPTQPATEPIPVSAVAPSFAFTTDRESLNAGECATLNWNVTEVNGVWLNDSGVAGQGNQKVCPTQTQTYKLKIQKRDGTFEERSVTIQVSGTAPPVTNPPPAPADSAYGTLSVISADTRRPPEGNPDLNLSLLGYQPNGVAATYKDYGPVDDPSAPQFRSLFADHRQPGFTTSFINNGWDWGSNSRTTPSPGKFEVTVIGVAVSPGESLLTPGSGRSIGNGYSAMVLYADNNQITLKYTPDDSVARGYTVFIVGVNVNPQLLALYQSTNGAGRGNLPALRAGQLLGTAAGGEIRLAIRDNATFMDPRSQQDWWR